MVKKLIFTPYFKRSFKEILDFISLDSLNIALDFRDDCFKKFESLTHFSKLGVEIEKNIRKYKIHKNYVIYYKILNNEILILSIKNVKKKYSKF